MALSAEDLSGNLAGGVGGGLGLCCLLQIFSAAFCVSFSAPSSQRCAEGNYREHYWEGSRVVAGAVLKQLDGGQYRSSIRALSHPDAAMVATLPAPSQQLLISLPSQPCYVLCGHNPLLENDCMITFWINTERGKFEYRSSSG